MPRLASAALLIFAMSLPLTAQPRPDFSGTWVMDTRRSDSAQATNSTRISSATLQIAQSDREVRIDAVRNGVAQAARYPLRSAEPPRAVGTSGSIGSVVEWDGDTLVTITPHSVNGMAVTTTERRTLSPDGREMTVVSTLRVEHGYSGTGSVNFSSPSTDVYIRQAR